MEVILNAEQISTAMGKLADDISQTCPADIDIAVVGIRSRGEIIGHRISKILSQKLGKAIPSGTLDITLYRDDLNSPNADIHPVVRSTEIPFNIDEKIIVLIDDVLYTGRSIRAAMDALIDLGRPKAIKLAVLVDRGGRELPIQADYAACTLDVAATKLVEVNLIETDEMDQVLVSKN